MTTVTGFSALSSSGVVLSLPHATGMQSSLPLLKKNYKFTKVFFWGKLMGMTGEYLIAKGIEESYGNKKFFFCQDGVSWAQLPACTEEMVEMVTKVTSYGLQLSGDMSKQIEIPADPVPEGEEPPEEPPEPKVVTEIMRVAVMVEEIDSECAMCPLGALMKKADGTITDTPTFMGLTHEGAVDDTSYVLMNQAKPKDPLVDALTATSDFLKPCSEIVPKGSLTCKFDEVKSTVVWRSLLYPGFMAYATVGSPSYGYAYVGTGLKNVDIAHMLP